MKINFVYSILLFLMLIVFCATVYGQGLWDRPVYVFNESAFNESLNITFSNYYTKTQSDALFMPLTENISIYQTITNEETGRINNDTAIIELINNLPVYNDTELRNYIDKLNNSIIALNNSINNLDNKIDIINSSIKQPIGIYLQNTSTTFQVNETMLNNTINVIAQNRVMNYSITINGSQTITTSIISYIITAIQVMPLSNVTYRFNASEGINIIERDRIEHSSEWYIEKNYAINNNVTLSINEIINTSLYNVTIFYIDNGVTP